MWGGASRLVSVVRGGGWCGGEEVERIAAGLGHQVGAWQGRIRDRQLGPGQEEREGHGYGLTGQSPGRGREKTGTAEGRGQGKAARCGADGDGDGRTDRVRGVLAQVVDGSSG